jgi:two-component system, chemotaxis family, CheB/CheR fusion protein
LTVLVNDLLDVGRLQSGKLRLHLQPVDLVPLVRRTVAAVRLNTHEPVLAFAAPDRRLLVRGDATRLEQVLVNLLNNAIQYAPQSKRIEVRLLGGEQDVELHVQDYGPGIPLADLPHVFSRLYQVTRSDEHAGSGLGLGLYLTKELVTLHGGTIAVESHEGVGTLFTIRLPLMETAKGMSRAPDRELGARTGER